MPNIWEQRGDYIYTNEHWDNICVLGLVRINFTYMMDMSLPSFILSLSQFYIRGEIVEEKGGEGYCLMTYTCCTYVCFVCCCESCERQIITW